MPSRMTFSLLAVQMSNSKAYNQVVRDYAEVVNELLNNALYCASRLHHLNQGRPISNRSDSSPVFRIEELHASHDPRVRKIMQIYEEAIAMLHRMRAYWLTTPEWLDGEEL